MVDYDCCIKVVRSKTLLKVKANLNFNAVIEVHLQFMSH